MSCKCRATEEVVIRFGCWDNFKSRLIRWITKSPYSHVWIEYHSKRWKGIMVYHSDYKGVMIESLANFHKRRGFPSNSVTYQIKGDTEEAFNKTRDYLGMNYGYLALVLNSLILLLRRIGFNPSRAFTDKNKYICSESATLFIQDSNIKTPFEPEFVWPGKLWVWVNHNLRSFRKKVNNIKCIERQ